jgi:hypothetical protein
MRFNLAFKGLMLFREIFTFNFETYEKYPRAKCGEDKIVS